MSDFLPDSVVERILLKLPHTALVRFTSVSKPWNSLISSHNFIVQHSLSNPIDPLILTFHSTRSFLSTFCIDPSLTFTPIDSPSYPFSLRFLQSVHGLVCLHHAHNVILWNPSINKHFRIPAPTLGPAAGIGFGFDSKNHDFKVIRIVHSCRVELYSLNQGCWKDIDVPLEVDLSLKFSDTPCFLNGNVHWLVYHDDIYGDEKHILMFDVEEEKFGKLEFPAKLVKALFMNLKVTVIGDNLSVLNCKSRRDWCDIWMVGYHGVWNKMYSFNIVGGRGISNVFGLSSKETVIVLRQDPEEEESERTYFSMHSFTYQSELVEFFDVEGEVSSVCEYTPGSLFLLDKA
ncbi:hypothetical protein TanjilG_06697 [Lupinus angustifolius]|uniref:F-box domain-containing protein n=1 Tax=Lupinus angustifolius TaxID=3871 RepID=A0A1J7HNY9_LUPAN|nr:PREDICTED: F-box/kelch-repeat protein At3g23880-like [Lupinus angustifolius]OIW08154.1 hypothetical protein TanjilG_06697 [Lupinus angustifolius]